MSICQVSGRITRSNGAPLPQVCVAWRLDSGPNAHVTDGDGNSLSPEDEIQVFTDPNGDFSVNLIQGQRMIVRVDELRLYRQVKIPAQAAATLEEVLNADI